MNQDLTSGKNGFKSVGGRILLYRRRDSHPSKTGGKFEGGIEVSLKMKLLRSFAGQEEHVAGLETEERQGLNHLEGNVQVQYELWGWFKVGSVERGGMRILVV